MITDFIGGRRRDNAGESPKARDASRLRHAFLAILTLLVLVHATIAAPVLAQTTPTPAPAPGTTPQQQAPEVERFKDWSLQCTQAQGEKPRTCFLIHDVFPTEGKARILQIVVGRFGQESILGALLFVPLGIRLPPGLSVQIDQGEAQRLPLEMCSAKGCQAQVALDEAFLAKLKAGSGGEVTFEDSLGRQVAVPFSLQGFTAGLNKLP